MIKWMGSAGESRVAVVGQRRDRERHCYLAFHDVETVGRALLPSRPLEIQDCPSRSYLTLDYTTGAPWMVVVGRWTTKFSPVVGSTMDLGTPRELDKRANAWAIDNSCIAAGSGPILYLSRNGGGFVKCAQLDLAADTRYELILRRDAMFIGYGAHTMSYRVSEAPMLRLDAQSDLRSTFGNTSQAPILGRLRDDTLWVLQCGVLALREPKGTAWSRLAAPEGESFRTKVWAKEVFWKRGSEAWFYFAKSGRLYSLGVNRRWHLLACEPGLIDAVAIDDNTIVGAKKNQVVPIRLL